MKRRDMLLGSMAAVGAAAIPSLAKAGTWCSEDKVEAAPPTPEDYEVLDPPPSDVVPIYVNTRIHLLPYLPTTGLGLEVLQQRMMHLAERRGQQGSKYGFPHAWQGRTLVWLRSPKGLVLGWTSNAAFQAISGLQFPAGAFHVGQCVRLDAVERGKPMVSTRPVERRAIFSRTDPHDPNRIIELVPCDDAKPIDLGFSNHVIVTVWVLGARVQDLFGTDQLSDYEKITS